MDDKSSFNYNREIDILCIDKRRLYPERQSGELGDPGRQGKTPRGNRW
jgi:hypothetical protein